MYVVFLLFSIRVILSFIASSLSNMHAYFSLLNMRKSADGNQFLVRLFVLLKRKRESEWVCACARATQRSPVSEETSLISSSFSVQIGSVGSSHLRNRVLLPLTLLPRSNRSFHVFIEPYDINKLLYVNFSASSTPPAMLILATLKKKGVWFNWAA